MFVGRDPLKGRYGSGPQFGGVLAADLPAVLDVGSLIIGIGPGGMLPGRTVLLDRLVGISTDVGARIFEMPPMPMSGRANGTIGPASLTPIFPTPVSPFPPAVSPFCA
jgi:hypothetical protein